MQHSFTHSDIMNFTFNEFVDYYEMSKELSKFRI